MATGKEIRTQISSVKNTQKITRAMEMVAASKMRKAQDRMQASRPYAKIISKVACHLSHASSECRHPYMIARKVNKAAIIVVSSDRGLCGGLNINLFKTVIGQMHTWEQEEIEIDVCCIGKKASQFFGRIKANVVTQVTGLGDTPYIMDVLDSVLLLLSDYKEGKIDKLCIVYNKFVNTMTQEPVLYQLLPLKFGNPKDEMPAHWDYIYESESKELVEELLNRYIESLVYQAIVENIACEQSARMVAMKSATDNAGDMIDSLELAYNKARQAAITQELSEIVGGAAAV